MQLTRSYIEDVLGQIYHSAEKYPIPAKLIKKVDDGSKYGNEVIQNLNGSYGYNYQVLALLVRHLKPNIILELGNQLGVSTAMMYYEMQPKARIISVDIVKDQRFLPEEIRKDDRVRLVIGDALNLNTYADNIPMGVDLLFTDTVHSYKQFFNEFSIYQHLLADKAVILVDDIHLNDKGRFFHELQFPKWDIGPLAHYSGFGVILYERKGEELNLSVDRRMARAALASAGFWRNEFENLADRHIHINKVRIKQDIKKGLRRYPRIERGIVNHLAPALRRFIQGVQKLKNLNFKSI